MPIAGVGRYCLNDALTGRRIGLVEPELDALERLRDQIGDHHLAVTVLGIREWGNEIDEPDLIP